MKALFISIDRDVNESKFWEITGCENLDGMEKISPRAFMFDLSVANNYLAQLQVYFQERESAYHLIYLPDDTIHFQQPVLDLKNFKDPAPRY